MASGRQTITRCLGGLLPVRFTITEYANESMGSSRAVEAVVVSLSLLTGTVLLLLQAFSPSQDPQSADWSSAKSMQEFPVTSFMTTPRS